MARSTMANVIQQLRDLTNMGTAAYSSGAVTYWSDDQLQDVLDRNRMDVRELRLLPMPQTNGSSSSIYLDYQIPETVRWLEQGTSVVSILNETYGTVSSASYTVDYNRHVVTFNADTEGVTRYLRGSSYDVHGAAADVWGKVEAYYSHQVDWASDNHDVKASQKVKQARIAKHREEALSRRGGDTRLVRMDETAWRG